MTELTKHIKSSAETDVTSSDSYELHQKERELSNYFPEFLWLVRDFTLELSDESGKPISSRDYLEMALEV